MTRRVQATNTTATYGWVERSFHWAIALLVATALVLGKVAYDAGYATDAALARKAFLFSFHKTVGLTIFAVALARIAWALSQPRPRPLHPQARAETFLAGAVHWLLYGSLVIVPLLGWTEHSATTGFAPIWWPFGQSLPFVPKDPELAARLAVLHVTFVTVLVGALVLHVAGTVKHVVVDRDRTFARMWRGADPGPLAAAKGHAAPALAALAVWAVAFGAALNLSAGETTAAAVAVAAPEASGAAAWNVEAGTLSIEVAQMGSGVTGTFADWQAAIDFDPEARADGTFGRVEVAVGTGSLTLGSVTPQAIAPDFLSAGAFPTATFVADIRPGPSGGYVADGTLAIRDVTVPVTLPFALEFEGDVARMSGRAEVDRRDYGMGEAYPDESSVGFTVAIDVALTARRAK